MIGGFPLNHDTIQDGSHLFVDFLQLLLGMDTSMPPHETGRKDESEVDTAHTIH